MRIRLLLPSLFLVPACLLAQMQPEGSQQPQTPQSSRQIASPRGQANYSFADSKQITVDYGRPFMRGRKIMGGLVPYGKVWRTGANAATSFVTQADLDLAGTHIPAGSYTMYTVPAEDSWTIIINRQTGQWGTVYNQAQDLVRVKAPVSHLDQPVDQFTISFQNHGPKAGVMKLEWENTSVATEFSEASAK
jgi:hypothetical protein